MPSDMRAIAPTMPASSVISRMSRFRTWAISCAITACSSSRDSAARSPSVTATLAVAASRPVANALGSASGITQTLGLGSPEAMAISSTTFISCFCSGVAGSISSQAPVDHSTRSAP